MEVRFAQLGGLFEMNQPKGAVLFWPRKRFESNPFSVEQTEPGIPAESRSAKVAKYTTPKQREGHPQECSCYVIAS